MDTKHTCAIIVAAGRSTRMGRNKQMIPLGRMTVIERCLDQFQKSQTVDSIVVVTSAELLPIIRNLPFSKICAVIEGGNTRQESVLRGLRAVPQNCRYIAVHDGARPFTTPTLIDRVLHAAYDIGAAVPVIPVTSTVKRIDLSGRIIGTEDREYLRLVQTPQAFELEQYQRALDQAVAEHADLTDDCQLFERMGWPIAWVEGHEENIKLTTPTDIMLAQIIAQRRDDDENRNRL